MPAAGTHMWTEGSPGRQGSSPVCLQPLSPGRAQSHRVAPARGGPVLAPTLAHSPPRDTKLTACFSTFGLTPISPTWPLSLTGLGEEVKIITRFHFSVAENQTKQHPRFDEELHICRGRCLPVTEEKSPRGGSLDGPPGWLRAPFLPLLPLLPSPPLHASKLKGHAVT